MYPLTAAAPLALSLLDLAGGAKTQGGGEPEDGQDGGSYRLAFENTFSGKMMVAGNNKGTVSLLTLEGEKIWDHRLHKSKCNFVQFSDRQPWMMVTCSTGKDNHRTM